MKHKISLLIISCSSAIVLAACIPCSVDTYATETDASNKKFGT